MAALCFGTRVSLQIPVLHRGGKRQAAWPGPTVFAHAGIVGFSSFLMLTQRKWTQKTLVLHFNLTVV